MADDQSFGAHVPDLVVGCRSARPPVAGRPPSSTRRKSVVTRLMLEDHSNIFMYCSRYTLFTPRNGRRKFRSPVHSPSRVLQCTSRTPSPSSSRAHSPAWWFTVACLRPAAFSGLYPVHSSVYTIAPGFVRGTTIWCTSSAAQFRRPTRRQSRLSARPATPQTGGRSVSQVPCPTALFARRRGG